MYLIVCATSVDAEFNQFQTPLLSTKFLSIQQLYTISFSTRMSQTDAPEATSPVTKRVVPGAPPTVEKATKKKRKTKTKLDEEGKENASNAPPAPSQAPEVPPSTSAELQISGDDKKSTILELINKRIRNFTKKIVRLTLLFLRILQV
jgi:hypothetical protein